MLHRTSATTARLLPIAARGLMSQQLPLCATSPAAASAPPAGLHFASRAVKCTTEPTSIGFRCPADGSGMMLQSRTGTTRVHLQQQLPLCKENRGSSSVSVHAGASGATVVGVRNGAVFMRCDDAAEVEFDVVQDDILAIFSKLTAPQVDAAIESLLCSLSRSVHSVEEVAENMLVDSQAGDGALTMISAVSSECSSESQPPEYFQS